MSTIFDQIDTLRAGAAGLPTPASTPTPSAAPTNIFDQIDALRAQPAPAAAPPPPASNPGFFSELGSGFMRGAGGAVSSVGTLLEKAGADQGLVQRIGTSLEKYGADVAAKHPDQAPEFSQNPLGYIGGAAGGLLGGVLPAVAGGAAATALAPEALGAGAVAGLSMLGGTLAQTPIQAGANLQAQEAQGQTPDVGRALVTGAAQSALMNVPGGVAARGVGTLVGRTGETAVQKALSDMTATAAQKVGAALGKVAGTGIEQGVLGTAAQGVGIVGNAPDVQSGLQQLTSEKGVGDLVSSFAQNAAGGAALRGLSLPVEAVKARRLVSAARNAGDPTVMVSDAVRSLRKDLPDAKQAITYAAEAGIDLGGAAKYDQVLKQIATRQVTEARNAASPLTANNNLQALGGRLPTLDDVQQQLMQQGVPVPDGLTYDKGLQLVQQQLAQQQVRDALSGPPESFAAQRDALLDQVQTLEATPSRTADQTAVLTATKRTLNDLGVAAPLPETAARIAKFNDNPQVLYAGLQQAQRRGQAADVEAYAVRLQALQADPAARARLPDDFDAAQVLQAAREQQMAKLPRAEAPPSPPAEPVQGELPLEGGALAVPRDETNPQRDLFAPEPMAPLEFEAPRTAPPPSPPTEPVQGELPLEGGVNPQGDAPVGMPRAASPDPVAPAPTRVPGQRALLGPDGQPTAQVAAQASQAAAARRFVQAEQQPLPLEGGAGAAPAVPDYTPVVNALRQTVDSLSAKATRTPAEQSALSRAQQSLTALQPGEPAVAPRMQQRTLLTRDGQVRPEVAAQAGPQSLAEAQQHLLDVTSNPKASLDARAAAVQTAREWLAKPARTDAEAIQAQHVSEVVNALEGDVIAAHRDALNRSVSNVGALWKIAKTEGLRRTAERAMWTRSQLVDAIATNRVRQTEVPPPKLIARVTKANTPKPVSPTLGVADKILHRQGDMGDVKLPQTFDSTALTDGLATGHTAAVMSHVADYLDKLPDLRPIAAWIKQAGDGVTLRLSDEAPMVDGRPVHGAYDPATDAVTIYRTGVHPAIVAHEVVHALTERAMQKAETLVQSGKPLATSDRTLVDAYRRVLTTFDEFRQKMPDAQAYGLTNEREFLAEVLTNPVFRADLMQRPGERLWGRVVDAVRRLLGLPSKQARALNDVFLAAQTLAYNAPGATFMPPEMRQLFFAPDLGARINKQYADANKGGVPEWRKFLSTATAASRRLRLYASSSHHINEVFGQRGMGLRGVGEWFDLLGRKAAMESQANTALGQFGDQFQSFRKENPAHAKALMTGLTLHSQMRLTPKQVTAVLRGKETYDSLLAQEKATKGEVKSQLALMGRENFDRMVSALKLIGWNDAPRTSRPRAQWGANEWGHEMFRMTAAAARDRYDAAVRAKAYQVLGDAAVLDPKAIPLPEVLERFHKDATPDVAQDVAQASEEFAQAIARPYLPTFRQGDYWVGVRQHGEGGEGAPQTVYFRKFGSEIEAKTLFDQLNKDTTLRGDAYTVSYGKTADLLKQSMETSALLRLVQKTVDNVEQSAVFTDVQRAELRDALMQSAYLALPEVSDLKNLIHRKGTPGWDVDEQFQGLMEHLLHSNYSNATQRHLPLIERSIDLLHTDVRNLNDPKLYGIEPGKLTPVMAQEVVDELTTRFVNSTRQVQTPVIDAARSLTYNWQLALSPSYIVANLTQPFVLTLPTLGAKYGFARSALELMSGMRKAGAIVGVMLKRGLSGVVLNDELIADLRSKKIFSDTQLRAVESMLASGKVDFTLAKEAGQLARGASGTQAKLMRVLSAGSHYVEVVNRISTGLAAFEMELARQQGKGVKGAAAETAAQRMAEWAITDTQFLYDNYNQGRAFGRQGFAGEKITPLIMTFQNYNLMLMEKYARHIGRAINHDFAPAERAEATKAVTGMLLATASVAGVAGLPLASAVMAGAQMLTGDDDDIHASVRTWLRTAAGSTLGEALSEGIPAAAGVNMTNMAGQQAILPYSYTLFSGKPLGEMTAPDFLKSMSPTVGTGLGIVNLVPNAWKFIVDGDGSAAAGMVQGLPGALRGVGRAAVGNRDAQGVPLPGNDSLTDKVMQSFGLTPAAREEQLFASFAARHKEKRIQERGATLRKQMIHALDEGDMGHYQELVPEASAFMQQYPTQPNIFASVQEGAKKLSVRKSFYTQTNLGNYMTPRQMLLNQELNDALGLGYTSGGDDGTDD